jgi:uncharacterized protein
MNVRSMFVTLLSLIASVGLPQYGFAADTPAAAKSRAKSAQQRHNVIFQVSDNDPAKWNLTLNNARNVQEDLGQKSVNIEIVAYGPGIGMLKIDSPVGNRVGEAMATGIKVMACENTMSNQKIGREDMLSGIGYVKAGVVELMRRQQQGWAYIRP